MSDMKTTRRNPYNDLLAEFREFVGKVVYPRRVSMWTYPKDRLSENWNLSALNERVSAAQQLGFDVVLSATEKGLVVEYLQKRPEAPWRVR